ncbi:hypothetical protein C9439_00360 [archaeon SCG-AAA382B04]|nr:hypothetical protein C9439_00360 [archaeon SCG-AAA382B04]
MKSKTFFTNQSDPKKATKDLKRKIDKNLNFSPDLALFYSTLKYQGNFNKILDNIQDKINDVPLIGGTIDAAVYPNELRTDGIFIVLCKDDDAEFEVISSNKRGKDGFKEISKKIENKKEKTETIILNYPLVFLKHRRELLSFLSRGKYYDIISSKRSIPKYAKNFSKYLYNRGIVNSPNRVLKQISQKINKPIISINLLHSKFKIGAPKTFSNYNLLEGGISALLIKNKEINLSYGDIFPEKPKEEQNTSKFLNKKFKILDKSEIEKYKNIIYLINNTSPLKAIKDVKETIEMGEKEMVEEIESGKLSSEVPYALFLENKETGGICNVGISDIYPFKMFPTYLDLDNFSNQSYLGFEPLPEFQEFLSSLKNLRSPQESFVFSIFDISSLESFDTSNINYQEKLKNKLQENHFSLITGSPGIYLPEKYQKKDFLPEAEENIFFTGNGISISLEI